MEDSHRQGLAEAQAYFAPDGLMKLWKHEERECFPEAAVPLRTAANDNGILFAVYFYWLVYSAIEDEQERTNFTATSVFNLLFRDAVSRLACFKGRGLFDRNPGRHDERDKLDNYVGIVSGSVLFGYDDEYPRWIVNWGTSHGWFFDNVTPSSPQINCWRQGADIAFYQMSAGFYPSWIDYLWLIAGIIFNAYQKDLDARSSEHLLTWARLKAIDRKWDKGEQFSALQCLLFLGARLARLFWVRKLRQKTPDQVGMEHVFRVYFKDPEHPCRKLSVGRVY